MKIFKTILRWLGYLLLLLVLLVAAQIGWGIYREPIAKKEAQDFCATVKIGQSSDGIQERAIASGAFKSWAKWHNMPDYTRTMSVMYIGMPPYSRHSCVIKATDVVQSAEYSHMD